METTAASVGNVFVKQYYTTLATQPDNLHRFYEDESQFHHFHGPEDFGSAPIKGQKDIHKKIMSLDLEVGAVQVNLEKDGSVDCMSSANGGVIVTVTGWISTRKELPKKPFVQTFFLSKSGSKKYYLLNDSFRYLPVYKSLEENKVVSASNSNNILGNNTTIQNVNVSNTIAATKVEVVSSPKIEIRENAPGPIKKEEAVKNNEVKREKEIKPIEAPKVIETDPSPPLPVKKEKGVVKEENKGPKTWLSIANTGPIAAKSSTPPSTIKKEEKKEEKKVEKRDDKKEEKAVGNEAIVKDEAPTSKKEVVKGSRKTCSLLCEGFEANKIKREDIVKSFSIFGHVENLTIVNGRGRAYVDFNNPQSVEKAVEAGKKGEVKLGGVAVLIQAKESGGIKSGGGGGGRDRNRDRYRDRNGNEKKEKPSS